MDKHGKITTFTVITAVGARRAVPFSEPTNPPFITSTRGTIANNQDTVTTHLDDLSQKISQIKRD